MPEIVIVETKDRKGRTRYGWRCDACRLAAGAWPKRKTAEDSAETHERSADYCKRIAGKRAAA